jgi:hypothetical protein
MNPTPSQSDIEDPASELALIEAEFKRRQYRRDPNLWAAERLGDILWSGQRKINDAVANHRRVNVLSCHEIGKSFDAALLAGWWIDVWPAGDAFVVTSAPTGAQVRAILWREIGRVHTRGKLPGRVNQTEWMIPVPGGRDELVAFGRKPDEYDPAAFQGIHALRVLAIFDEANGIRGGLWEAADSLIANDFSKIIAIGNPDDPSGEFYENCKSGSGWYTMSIGAFDSPNFTGEAMPERVLQQLIGRTYVEEKRKKWAPTWHWNDAATRVVPPPDGKMEDTHPFWQSKILGQFPMQSAAGSLIPLTWIHDAQVRTLPPDGPNELGLDVGASVNGDPSCLGWRRGPVFRVLYEDRQPDTMLTLGKMLLHLRRPDIGATAVKVDYIGVGRGVVDRAREEGMPVYPVSVGQVSTVSTCLLCHTEWDELVTGTDYCPKCGSRTTQKVFANLLSQLWWSVRGLFERGEIDIDPLDEDLAAELLTMRWEPNSRGQTVVKYSDGPSPNRADALLMTFAPVPVEVASFLTW